MRASFSRNFNLNDQSNILLAITLVLRMIYQIFDGNLSSVLINISSNIFPTMDFSDRFNPLMLTAAKTSLTILMKSFFLKHDWQNT